MRRQDERLAAPQRRVNDIDGGVPEAGLEPALHCWNVLVTRLPIPPFGHVHENGGNDLRTWQSSLLAPSRAGWRAIQRAPSPKQRSHVQRNARRVRCAQDYLNRARSITNPFPGSFDSRYTIPPRPKPATERPDRQLDALSKDAIAIDDIVNQPAMARLARRVRKDPQIAAQIGAHCVPRRAER